MDKCSTDIWSPIRHLVRNRLWLSLSLFGVAENSSQNINLIIKIYYTTGKYRFFYKLICCFLTFTLICCFLTFTFICFFSTFMFICCSIFVVAVGYSCECILKYILCIRILSKICHLALLMFLWFFSHIFPYFSWTHKTRGFQTHSEVFDDLSLWNTSFLGNFCLISSFYCDFMLE